MSFKINMKLNGRPQGFLDELSSLVKFHKVIFTSDDKIRKIPVISRSNKEFVLYILDTLASFLFKMILKTINKPHHAEGLWVLMS